MSTDLDLHPYTDADIERVLASQVRAGDLLALRGPAGSGRWSGNLVLDARYGGTASLGGEMYLLTVRQAVDGYEGCPLQQPESIPVCRIRKSHIKDGAA